MRLLIGGGPTHEHLDDVRFLTNGSTGTLALALARAARERGHEVDLVLGPTHLEPPPGVRAARVVSALEMQAALEARFSACEALVMCAAVSDYRPRERRPGKWKKGPDEDTLELTKNPDILAGLGKMAQAQVVVGFALESSPPPEALAAARGKLAAKRCDLIVLNHARSLGGSHNRGVVFVTEEGASERGDLDKNTLAHELLDEIEARVRRRGP